MYVCMYSSDNFWTAWPIDLIFSMQVGHTIAMSSMSTKVIGPRSRSQQPKVCVYPDDNFRTAWPIDLICSMQVGHYHI